MMDTILTFAATLWPFVLIGAFAFAGAAFFVMGFIHAWFDYTPLRPARYPSRFARMLKVTINYYSRALKKTQDVFHTFAK